MACLGGLVTTGLSSGRDALSIAASNQARQDPHEVLERGARPGHIPSRLARSGPSIRRSVPMGACCSCGASPFLACAWRCPAAATTPGGTCRSPPARTRHFPAGDSENMRRVMGAQVETPVLTPEPGDVWPGPLPPEPTLQELEQQGQQRVQSGRYRARRSFRRHRRQTCRRCRHAGSSTPPGSKQPGVARLPSPTAPPPVNTAPPSPNPAGQVTPDAARARRSPPVAPAATRPLTTPGGGSAIVVPNGNGTSTIIHSDGKIETVPTPR